jgi:hypothetical protein
MSAAITRPNSISCICQFVGSKRVATTRARAITLTPMIHDDRPVVELNDAGFISYMGLNGTTTNGTLMVQLRDMDEMRRQLESQGVVPAVDQEPSYAGERSRAVSILSTEVVQTLYMTLGTDPEIIKTRLRKLRGQDENPNIDQIQSPGNVWYRHLASLAVPIRLDLRPLKRSANSIGRKTRRCPLLCRPQADEGRTSISLARAR